MCCPPISACRVINMVVTGSLQHIVFLLHQEKKQLASPHFLQTVNLLVYSIPSLRELNIFFGHKYHTCLSPLCVNTEAKQQKDQISMLTRGVSHTGWGHNIRGTSCPILYTEWGQWAVEVNYTVFHKAGIYPLEKYYKLSSRHSAVQQFKPRTTECLTRVPLWFKPIIIRDKSCK